MAYLDYNGLEYLKGKLDDTYETIADANDLKSQISEKTKNLLIIENMSGASGSGYKAFISTNGALAESLPAGTYTFSFRADTDANSDIYLGVYDSATSAGSSHRMIWQHFTKRNEIIHTTFTVSFPILAIYFWAASTQAGSNTHTVTVYEAQLEKGSVYSEIIQHNETAKDWIARHEIAELYKVPVHLEPGAFDSSHISENRFTKYFSDLASYLISSYDIVVEGANKISFYGLPFSFTGNILIYCYDKTGTLIGSRITASNNDVVTLNSGTYYINLELPKFDTSNNTFGITLYNGTGKGRESKRFYTNSNNQIIELFAVNDDVNTGMAFMLPPNYTPNGKPVPVVLWFGGNQTYNYPDSGFHNYYQNGLSYIRDEGFAVLQVYSWGTHYYNQYNDAGKDQPYPVATCINCITKGVQYFGDRYNVDLENVHVMSHSVGGIMSLYFTSIPAFKIKSVGMFAPVVDFLSMRGRYPSTRHILVEELNLTGDTTDFYDINSDGSTQSGVDNYYFSPRCVPFWEDNFPDIIRLNPAWLHLIGATATAKFNTAISDAQTWWADKTSPSVYDDNSYEKMAVIPVKVWMAKDDTDTPYLAVSEIVAQLQNGGSTAEMHSFNSGGHLVFDIDKADITTSLNIEHEDIGAAWRENIVWIRENMMK